VATKSRNHQFRHIAVGGTILISATLAFAQQTNSAPFDTMRCIDTYEADQAKFLARTKALADQGKLPAPMKDAKDKEIRELYSKQFFPNVGKQGNDAANKKWCDDRVMDLRGRTAALDAPPPPPVAPPAQIVAPSAAPGASGVQGASSSPTQLRSVNVPNAFIRHQQGIGRLTPLASDLDKKDASFLIRPGLAGAGVSFESANFSGHYLRHQNGQIRLGRADNNVLFKKDASFHQRPGLAGKGTSFESVNFPGAYLRHCRGMIFIDDAKGRNKACSADPAVAKQDASFDLITTQSAVPTAPQSKPAIQAGPPAVPAPVRPVTPPAPVAAAPAPLSPEAYRQCMTDGSAIFQAGQKQFNSQTRREQDKNEWRNKEGAYFNAQEQFRGQQYQSICDKYKSTATTAKDFAFRVK
jgi:hypothetical protein